MTLDVSTIRERLRFLGEADRGRVVFGAESHDYLLRPCVRESDLADFERRYSIRLPEEYRVFLTELGNGGAGPYYGIQGLDELRETSDDYTWADLSKPFPYTDRWEGPPDLVKAIREMDGGDRRSELVEEYWRDDSRHGSIAICEFGCNLRFLLVVNGDEYGTIWFDATADLVGYSPVVVDHRAPAEEYANWCIPNDEHPSGQRVTFGEWYCCWLDWACRLVQRGISGEGA